jgi:toxin-antitoxin system PIN domain toxin
MRRPKRSTSRTDLPDVNVWLAATVPGHPHHDRAITWWHDEAPGRVAFVRITALALVRLLTQPAVMGGNPLAMGEAWQHYQRLRRLPEILLLPEPEATESILADWATTPWATPRLWTDAYLAACAEAGGCRLVTFDRDFRRFERTELLLLD